MKIIKNSDIKFRINKKLVYLPNFTIRFYTVNQKEYFLEKTQDDLVEYEREATVDDVDVILSGGTTVTEYYLPLNWNQLMFVGKGVLNYKLTNNIEDPEFPDYQFNKEEIVTTDFYIDSIEVDPEPEEGLIERIVLLEEHLDEEIVNRETADSFLSGAVDTEIARAISAETVLDEKIDAETNRAISAETALDEKIDAEETRASGEEQRIEGKLDQEIADRQTDVNAEEARAISAETALDAKIDAETNRATTAESALTDAINAEANRAISAETELSNAITNETNRATSAETTLDEKIVAETNRAISAETALNEALQAETNRATSAEAALDVKIDTVSGNVISETTRATTAENALSGAIESLDVRFFDDAKYEDSGNTKVINFYNAGVVKATIDASDFIVDGMVEDVRIENGYLVIDFNTASGKQDIQIPLTDIFNPDNYYLKSETSGATELSTEFATKLNTANFNTYSAATETAINNKADTSAVTAVQDSLSGYVYTADNGKQDIYGKKTFIGQKRLNFTQATLSDKLGFTLYDVRDGLGNAKEYGAFELNPTGITENSVTHPLMTLNHYRNNSGLNTQTYIGYRQYDQPHSAAYHLLAPLPENAKTPFNLTTTFQNYYFPLGFKNGSTMIKADNTGVVNLSSEFGGKVNTSDFETYSGTVDTALSGKQDTLIAGENITISGNVISAEGGGKAIEAGRGISITTGETADTVSFNLPIYLQGSTNLMYTSNYNTLKGDINSHHNSIFGNSNTIDKYGTNINFGCGYNNIFGTSNKLFVDDGSKVLTNNFICGEGNTISSSTVDIFDSFALGGYNKGNNQKQALIGWYNNATNIVEMSFGQYNVSSSGSSTFGDSGNTLFSVGNGTANNARHNAFEIRQNGDIYITLDGQDVKLQDQLGGSSYTAGDGIDITNDVISVTGKVSTSDFNTYSGTVDTALSGKQDTLVSGTNIKTINNESLLGSGNIDIQGGGGTVESAITSGSTNAVASSAIWSAVTYDASINETLEFNNTYAATNYPSGCTSVKFENNTGGELPVGDYVFTSGGSEVAKLTCTVIHWWPYEASWTSSDPKLTYVTEGNSAVTVSYSELASDIDGVTVPSAFTSACTATASEENYLWINENTYRKDEVYNKSEVDGIASGLQTNINEKLDATAYTPTVVDSTLNDVSNNPVANSALYDELRISNSTGTTETVITFDSDKFSENYLAECRKIKVEVTGTTYWSMIKLLSDKSESGSTDNQIEWYNNGSQNPLSVTLGSGLTEAGATYAISGNTFEVSYPSINNIQYIYAYILHNETIKAIASSTPLKDQVVANTTALGGLSLVMLTQAEYDALATKDNNTLYVIVG